MWSSASSVKTIANATTLWNTSIRIEKGIIEEEALPTKYQTWYEGYDHHIIALHHDKYSDWMQIENIW